MVECKTCNKRQSGEAPEAERERQCENIEQCPLANEDGHSGLAERAGQSRFKIQNASEKP